MPGLNHPPVWLNQDADGCFLTTGIISHGHDKIVRQHSFRAVSSAVAINFLKMHPKNGHFAVAFCYLFSGVAF